MIDRPPKQLYTKDAAAARASKLTVVPEQHREAVRRGAKCMQCPLLSCGEGPVIGEVVRNAPLAFVGEAPGTQEVDTGVVFVGKSGAKLNECLDRGGYSRDDVTVVNVLGCKPPIELQAYLFQLRRDHKIRSDRAKAAKKPPPPALVLPTEACFPRLVRDLDVSNSKVLVGVGGEGLRSIAKYTNTPFGQTKVPAGTPKIANVKKQQGAPVPLKDGRIVLGTYHPAFAFRKGSRHYLPTIEADLVRACDIARRGRIEWVEPEGIIAENADEAVNYLSMLLGSGARVMVDIETDSINIFTAKVREVGMSANVTTPRGKEERAICVPYNNANGAPFWRRPADKLRVANVQRRILDEAPLGFQNGTYDTAVLLRVGLMTDRMREWFDDLVAHHCTDHSELPHDLGFMLSRFFEAPRHKDDADHKSTDNVTDGIRRRYNLVDVLTQLRLVEPLRKRVIECDMADAFRVDTGLLPHARDMGILGRVVDDAKRMEFFTKLTAEANALREELRRIVGDPDFNPNSFKQVARFLYIAKGLTPPADPEATRREAEAGWINVPGVQNPWEVDEEEEESIDGLATNEPTLMYLLDQGVDKQTATMIERQLDFRSVSKLRGTYVGLKEDLDTGKIRDIHRERGVIIDHHEFAGLNGGKPLPIHHTRFAVHVVPGGRWSSKPNVQAEPETGAYNIRDQYVAAPGHELVGCDYEQGENRIYAVSAQDQVLLDAYARKIDVHSLNFAFMQSKAQNQKEIDYWYERTYNAEKYDPVHGKEIKKSARKKAKIFCVAEDSPVLTEHRGEVPIQSVQRSDRVWDGVDWVHHNGVVFQGFKEVLLHDGLWATAPHGVWLVNGQKTQHGLAAAAGWPLMPADMTIRSCPSKPPDFIPSRQAPVYDLLNAGPRRRFTAAGRLVSNCYLLTNSGQEDGLYRAMSIMRDPDGKRSFPDLKAGDVRMWCQNYHRGHPALKRWQNGVVNAWRDAGYVASMIDGRKCFFIGGVDVTAMPNFITQAGLASIINRGSKLVMDRCRYQAWGPLSGPTAQVHDSLVLQVPIGRGDEAAELLSEHMPYAHRGMNFPIALKRGFRYGEV